MTASVHKDRDGSPYAYGVWYLVNKGTGKILTPAQLEQLRQKYPKWRVYFVVPSWGVYRDLNRFAGRNVIIWRGKHDLHCTSYCPDEHWPQGNDEVELLGTSVQVPQSMRSRVEGKDLGELKVLDHIERLLKMSKEEVLEKL